MDDKHYLPEEKENGSTPRSVLITVLGTLFLLFVVNQVGALALSKYSMRYRSVNGKWEMLYNLKAPVDWLILGDSTGNAGVVPSMLNEAFNIRAVNLCTVSAVSILHNVWMLETYINKYGPPKNVMLVQYYELWSSNSSVVDTLKVPVSWLEWFRLKPRPNLSSVHFFTTFLMKEVPIYAYSKTVGDTLRYPAASFREKRIVEE